MSVSTKTLIEFNNENLNLGLSKEKIRNSKHHSDLYYKMHEGVRAGFQKLGEMYHNIFTTYSKPPAKNRAKEKELSVKKSLNAEIFNLISENSAFSDAQKTDLLLKLAKEFFNKGNVGAAYETAKKIPDPATRAKALEHLVDYFVKKGAFSEAAHVAKKDPGLKYRKLTQISEAAYAAGKKKESAVIAKEIEVPKEKVEILLNSARKELDKGRPATALSFIEPIPDKEAQSALYKETSELLCNKHQYTWARQVASEIPAEDVKKQASDLIKTRYKKRLASGIYTD